MPDDRWENVPTLHVLNPGEDVELPSDRAVNALWKHGPECMNPHRWQVEASQRQGRALIEVAYRAEWQEREGGTKTHSMGVDPEWKADRIAKVDAIVADAKKLKTKDGAEAMQLLQGVPSWWPKTTAYATLLDKLMEEQAKLQSEQAPLIPPVTQPLAGLGG